MTPVLGDSSHKLYPQEQWFLFNPYEQTSLLVILSPPPSSREECQPNNSKAFLPPLQTILRNKL